VGPPREPQDPYAYRGTAVLRNHLHTASADELFDGERETALQALAKLAAHPVRGRFDADHYTAIHARLFQDIYPFAGEYRTTEVYKDDPLTKAQFKFPVPPENITLLSAVLKHEIPDHDALRGLDRKALSSKLADVMVGTHTAHAFRDGNSRATREFARTLAASLGYKLNFTDLKKDDLLPALFARTYDRTNPVLPTLLERAIATPHSDPKVQLRYETAPAAPPVRRHTIEDAIKYSTHQADRDAVFVDGSWESRGRVQLWTPDQLLHVLASTRSASSPSTADVPRYAVRQYGAVYDPVTNKDLFIRLDHQRTDYPPRLQTSLDSYFERSPEPPKTPRRRGPDFDPP
jgi:cell filamentation protein